jgi:cell division protein FtsW
MFFLWIVGGLVGLAGMFAYQNSQHVARRVDGFLSPDLTPFSQLAYATDAIREGGFFGVGLGQGRVKSVLPDAHTDFIIAVAAEEYGVAFVFLIMALFAVIFIRSFFRLMNENDLFIRLAGTGLISLFALQAFINLGVAVRVLPAKGMTLPFISYGGSSLVATGILLGLLLCFTRTRPQGKFGDFLTQKGY